MKLLIKINKFLYKVIDFSNFEKDYYVYYLNEVFDGSLSDTEDIFFGLVQEKLDWVSINPSIEEKKLGWANKETYYSG